MTSFRLAALSLIAGALIGLAGCLDLASMSDVAFPARVPGLAADQPYVPLPVGSWVNESEIEAASIAGCMSAGCSPQAGVGLFTAKAAEATRIRRVIDDPDRLARHLLAPKPVRAGLPSRPVPAITTVERLIEPGTRGFIVRMSRRDGTKAAYGAVLTRERVVGTLSVVIVIGASEDAARRIAREVMAAL